MVNLSSLERKERLIIYSHDHDIVAIRAKGYYNNKYME